VPESKHYLLLRAVPTMRCNFRCSYCFVSNDEKSAGTTMFDQHPPEDWVRAMKQYDRYEVEFYFWGGEPFLPDGTYDLVKGWTSYDHVLPGSRIDTNMAFASRIVARCPTDKLKLNCSWHPQYHSLDEMLRKVRPLQERGMVGMVNFVASLRNLERLRDEYHLSIDDLIRRFDDLGVFLNVAADFALVKGRPAPECADYKRMILQYQCPEDWQQLRGEKSPCRCEANRHYFTVEANGDLVTCRDRRVCGNFFDGTLEFPECTVCTASCPSLVSYGFRTDNPFPFRRHLEEYVRRNRAYREERGRGTGVPATAVPAAAPRNAPNTARAPRVSVVLPTYNHLRFLPQAVDSVCRQTFGDFELIIVNDGSTDGTREYLDGLRDARLRIVHQDNKRLPEALNAGFRAARGELLTWVSADNYCAPTFLETLVAALDAHPGAGFACSAHAWIDEAGRVTGICRDQDLSYHKLLASNPGIASFLYRRACQERVGLYDPGMEGAEDWDYWLRLREHFEPVYVPAVLVYYRRHEDALTRRIPEKIRESSRRVFQKAWRRRSDVEIQELYPTIELCRDRQTAEFHAFLDFGTALLRSPFADPEVARRMLDTAATLRPDCVEVHANRAVASGRCRAWEQADALMDAVLQHERTPILLKMQQELRTARAANQPDLLLGIDLFAPDKATAEVFELERRTRRVFCPTGGEAAGVRERERTGPRELPAVQPASATGNPLLSVVLTTFNRPELLAEVLKGLAGQTAGREEFEVIVVDDGSRPPVPEVADRFAGRMRLKYLRQDNAGLAAARNVGIRAAQGDLVLFSDDDDAPGPELVAEHLRSHREYPDERVVVLGHLDWHPELDVTPLMHYVTHVGGEYFGFDRLQDGRFYDRWKWWGGLVSAKRSLLQSVEGPFDVRLRFGYEDTELVCRLADRQIRVLYNAHARSYMLKPVTFEEFCRRSYKQGRALHRVAAAHPETMVARYGLDRAVEEYREKYAGNLDAWVQKIGRFEALLTGDRRGPGPGTERHLQMLYAAYRECFRGHVLQGYVEQLEAVERGAVLLGEPVNGESPSPAAQSADTIRSVRAQSAARRHRVRRNRPAPDGPTAPGVRPLRIVFVDTNTPCFDAGSSSLRIHRIVKILVAQGHRIDYLYTNHYQSDKKYKAAYDGAVNFIKILPSVVGFRDYLHFHDGDGLDVVWITNLWALGYTDFALQLAAWLRENRPHTRLIIDTMDLHYKKFLRRFELSGRPQERETAERFLALEKKLYPLADRVLAVTAVEKRDILAHVGACRVEVIPNIHPVRSQGPSIHQRRHICFLGAFRISHNLDAVHWFLQEAYPLILREAPEIEFHILGHGNEAFRETFAAYPNVKVVGYVEDAERAVAQYRLFVCPMIYGAGMKGKLGVAAAAGTPFVTTSIGAEGFDFVDGRHCFIANQPAEFAARCVDLLRDDARWDRFRTNAAELLRRRFSVEVVGQEIAGLLRSLAARPGRTEAEHEARAAQIPHDAGANPAIAPAPKVSIVVVCHDGERYLPECLDSITRQTFREWELLLVDDGSTDGTRRIAEQYCRRDPRIKSFHFADRAGPYVRRNFAVERAAAEFIVMQEPDGLMSPHKLEVLYRVIAQDPRLAVVGSWYRDFLHVFQGLQHTDCQELPLEHEEIIEALATWQHALSHGSAIIRKEMFQTIGAYDANPFAADAFWLAKLAQYARCRPGVRVRNVPEHLTLRRVHTGEETTLLAGLDPRSRQRRYQDYCEVKLRKVREKIRAEPATDIAAELRNCDCSDFLVRFNAHIIRWENEPLDQKVLSELLRHSQGLFDQTLYVTCVRMLGDIERMQPDIARRYRNYDLLRAMALFALAMKDGSRQYVEREIQNHDSAPPRQFLADCLESNAPQDVQNWCAKRGGLGVQPIDNRRTVAVFG
jgi:glycosyltransferase involved in cell wall biosynthesis